MRNTILGVIAGLVLGTVGALAFSHFTNQALLDDLQAKLDAAKAAADRADKEKTDLASENTSLSGQMDQLQKDKPQATTTDDSPRTAAPITGINPLNLLGLAQGAMRAQQSGPARMFLFKNRLHLKPDQEAAIKKAMDADDQARRDLFRSAFQNGQRPDPTAMAGINSTQKTLASILDPEQQRQYTQLQTDEKNARADIAATSQIDQMSPLLQLSDQQREQMYNTLYQTQLGAPDGMTMMTNPQTAVTQASAVNDALAKVLSPDQMSLYTQQGSIVAQNSGGGPGGGRRNRGGGGGGGGGGGQGGGTATPAATGAPNGGAGYAVTPSMTTTSYAPAATTDTSATAPAAAQPTPTTNAAPVDASTSTNAPSTSATTNTPSSQ